MADNAGSGNGTSNGTPAAAPAGGTASPKAEASGSNKTNTAAAPAAAETTPPVPSKDGTASGTSDGKQPPKGDAAPAKPATKPPAKPVTAEEMQKAVERAAVAERNATKKIEDADKRAKAAEEERDRIKAEGAAKDTKLAELAQKALLDPSMDESTLLKTIKTLKGKAFNPAKFMETVALMMPDEADGEVKDPPAKEPTVKEAVEAALAEKERQAGEAATKAAEDKKKADQAALDQRIAETRKQFQTEMLESFKAETHPLLWERYEKSLDLLDEETAKSLITDKAIVAFQKIYTTKGERLTPAECIQFLELELTVKAEKKAAATKTPEQEMDDEFARIDKTWHEDKPLRLSEDDRPAPKKWEDMTVMERAFAQLEEDEKKKGSNRLF